jgi:hypothetical protein
MSVELKDYSFEGFFSSTSYLEYKPGIYAILCRHFEKNQVIDIGEAEDIKTRIDDHEGSGCWRRNCQSSLVYAALYTPDLNQKKREKIVDELRDEYSPPCGSV